MPEPALDKDAIGDAPDPTSGRSGILDRFAGLFVPVPMTRIGLFFLASDAEAVISALARTGACQIDQVPSELHEFLTSYFPEDFRESYRRLKRLHDALARRWQLEGMVGPGPGPGQVPTVDEIEQAIVGLESLEQQVRLLDQTIREARSRTDELKHFDHYVRTFADMGIDLASLANLRYLNVRVGTVPEENLLRLRESAEIGDHLVLDLGTKGDRTHILVVGAGNISTDLVGLLSKAHFEPVENLLIETAPDTDSVNDVGSVEDRIRAESLTVRKRLVQAEAEESDIRHRMSGLVLDAGRLLAHAEVLMKCDGALEGRLPVVFLAGWVPDEDVPTLEQRLSGEVQSPVVVTRQPFAEGQVSKGQEANPPSSIPSSGIFRSGSKLLELYGTPAYDEIDPTLILTLTAPLFFGMMFGDLGYGLLLAAGAIGARRWIEAWAPLIVACGISSSVFGLLYGSVFGVEHWLPALWLHPMEEPFRLLGFALWVGVGFVLTTFALNMAVLLRQGHPIEAVLGFRGGGGAVLYLGIVFLARSLYLQQTLEAGTIVLLVAGAASSLIHSGHEIYRNGQSALSRLVIEFFHGIITLFTNTLSFLRLAAFALAHSALSTALFLIADSFPASTGGWILRVGVLIVGSGLILILDVLAVGVQTVRLQFYEGLSRYYRGDGQAYVPLSFMRDRTRAGYPLP